MNKTEEFPKYILVYDGQLYNYLLMQNVTKSKPRNEIQFHSMQSLVLAYFKIKIGCMICLFWFLKIVRIKYIDNYN